MHDPVYTAELSHDTEGVNVEPFLADALDDIVERVMSAQKVWGLGFGLQDFLRDQEDLHELLAQAILSRDWTALNDVVEKRLRAKLEDSDAVFDLAVEIANDREEA